MAPSPRLVVALALVVAVGSAAPAQGARMRTIETPSRHVDVRTATFGTAHASEALRAKVLLPRGYSPRKRYPVLYLIHATGGDYRSWSMPGEGDIARTARGLDAIVVMPEAGLGFLTDWWNEGRRGDPAWERFYFEELFPLIERRFPVREGRRWRAIGGFSMGGSGALFLAAQRPGDFGAAFSISGFPSIQRPYLEASYPLFVGVDYRAMWGPATGFYATGHNPVRLAENLAATRVLVSAGDGTPRPGIPFGPTGAFGVPFQSALELESRSETDDFAAAARQASVDLTYNRHDGVHDWPYVREDLRSAIGWGLFKPVRERARAWTYRTVAQRGEAWGWRFRFRAPPESVQTLRRDGRELLGEGSGKVVLSSGRHCRLERTLPFRLRIERRCDRGR